MYTNRVLFLRGYEISFGDDQTSSLTLTYSNDRSNKSRSKDVHAIGLRDGGECIRLPTKRTAYGNGDDAWIVTTENPRCVVSETV